MIRLSSARHLEPLILPKQGLCMYVCIISPPSVKLFWSTTSDTVSYCFGTWAEELLITYTPKRPFPSTFSGSVFRHLTLITLTRPWLLLIIMSSTSYCSHLFTEPDNEPHWAVFGFHGVTRGVFLLDIYAFGCLCSWRRSFPFRQWGNHFSVLVFNIPAVFRIERAWMNMSGAFIWTQPLQIQKQ